MPIIALTMLVFSTLLAAASRCVLPLAALSGDAISDLRLLTDTRIVLELVADHAKEAPPKTMQKLQNLTSVLNLYRVNRISPVQTQLLGALMRLDEADLRHTPESFQRAVRLLRSWEKEQYPFDLMRDRVIGVINAIADFELSQKEISTLQKDLDTANAIYQEQRAVSEDGGGNPSRSRLRREAERGQYLNPIDSTAADVLFGGDKGRRRQNIDSLPSRR